MTPDSSARSARRGGVASATLTVAVMTVIAKGATAARDVVLADRFGVTSRLDAFFLAWTVITFFVAVLADSMTIALVPSYVSARASRDPDEARRLFAGSLTLAGALLMGVALVLGIFAPLIARLLASGFDHERRRQVVDMLRWLLPMLVLAGSSALWTGGLNARRRFAVPAFAPALVPLGAVLAVLAKSGSVDAAVVGTVIGIFAQTVVTAVAAARIGLPVRPGPVVDGARRVAVQYWPMVAGASLSSSALFVDQALATRLGPGSVSTLAYGARLPAFVTSVGGLALGASLLAHVSEQAAIGDVAATRKSIRKVLRVVAAFSVPVTVFLMLLSRPIVDVFLEHGALQAHDAAHIARVQRVFLAQVPFFLIGVVLTRVIAAYRANRLLALIAAVNITVNTVLDWVLMQRFGVAGIAFSTVCVYVVSSLLLYRALQPILAADASGQVSA